MANRTGARGPMPSGFGSRAQRSPRPQKQRKPKDFNFWDFLLPAIVGGVIFLVLSMALLTVGPRAMSLTTYFGPWLVFILILLVGGMFLLPVVELFILPKTGLKLMLVLWPADALLIGLTVWVINNVSVPI